MRGWGGRGGASAGKGACGRDLGQGLPPPPRVPGAGRGRGGWEARAAAGGEFWNGCGRTRGSGSVRRGRGSGLGVGVGVPEGGAGLGVWGGVGGWSWGSRLAGEGTAMELGVPVAEVRVSWHRARELSWGEPREEGASGSFQKASEGYQKKWRVRSL